MTGIVNYWVVWYEKAIMAASWAEKQPLMNLMDFISLPVQRRHTLGSGFKTTM